ncbi:MAG: fatty acid desaturase family protein [Proteobacteria bacterium]|nr:fatty acid desaturase family protein [Pseudomonadota bacterium]
MKIKNYLSKDEIAQFTAKSDFHGWRLLINNWLAIVAIFVLVANYTNPLTILIALPLLGGRQLGLAVLMHECGHRSLFKSTKLNDVLGQWLCALPIMNDMPSYARGHLKHHRAAGTEQDPDLSNYQAYPIPRESFRRKIIRDLSGQTGVKLLSYLVKGAATSMSNEKRQGITPLLQQLAVQLVMIFILSLFGVAWLYLLWAVAYLTAFMLFIRLRQVAEHAAVPDLFDLDPRKNTRTVVPRWWERALLAPNMVNYHMEHHFMASVPCYRLRALHRHLRGMGALANMPEFIGYSAVFSHVVTA